MRFFRRKYKRAPISHRQARMDMKTQKFNLLARYARRDLNYPNYNRYTWFRLFGFLPAGQGDITPIDEHGRALIHGISVYISVISGN